MIYPPIPPNCKYFNGGAFEVFDGDYCCICVILDSELFKSAISKIQNQHELKLWKPIIASVAYKAWINESIKRKYEPKVEPGTATQEFDPYGRQCYSNADAWAEWGLSK